MQINSQSRDVFYVSDGTAITCETLGHVVLGQFSFIPNEKTFPFVESEDKVADVIKEIEISYQRDGIKPLVFFSIEFDSEIAKYSGYKKSSLRKSPLDEGYDDRRTSNCLLKKKKQSF